MAEKLEIEQLNQLKSISNQLKDLSEILNALKCSNAMTLDEGIQELETRSKVTLHIAMVSIVYKHFLYSLVCFTLIVMTWFILLIISLQYSPPAIISSCYIR